MRVFDYNALFDDLIRNSVDPDTGEIINPDFEAQLAALEMDKEDKIEQAALAYKNAKADVDALDAVIKSLQAKKAGRERARDFFHDWLESQVEDKFKRPPLVSIYHSSTKKTDITDEAAIPDEFFTVTKTVQKDAIKKAILSGQKVPGAQVVDARYIVIK